MNWNPTEERYSTLQRTWASPPDALQCHISGTHVMIFLFCSGCKTPYSKSCQQNGSKLKGKCSLMISTKEMILAKGEWKIALKEGIQIEENMTQFIIWFRILFFHCSRSLFFLFLFVFCFSLNSPCFLLILLSYPLFICLSPPSVCVCFFPFVSSFIILILFLFFNSFFFSFFD